VIPAWTTGQRELVYRQAQMGFPIVVNDSSHLVIDNDGRPKSNERIPDDTMAKYGHV